MSDANNGGTGVTDLDQTIDSAAALFERAPTPTVAVSGRESPRVEVVNRAYLETFDGRESTESASRQFPRRARLSGAEREAVRRAATGALARDEIVKRTDDGRRRYAIRAIPVDAAGVTAFLQYRDVTVRRIRDQQLAVLRRVLRHDLRNDLTVILGYARTIAESCDDPDARAAATTVIESATDLRHVAVSAGRMQCVTGTLSSASLAEIVPRVRRDLGDIVPGGVSTDGPAPALQVDERVAIALEELCRTMAEHGGADALTIETDTADDWTHVMVRGDAVLSDQQRAALRGEAETKLRHASGLAPWLVRWSVRAAGGCCRVDEADGDATRVTIAVPTKDAPEQPAEPIAWPDD